MVRYVYHNILFIMLSIYTFSDQEKFPEPLKGMPICISLGCACGPAMSLRALHLRNEALPFDWTISSYDSICQALEDDFKYFCADLSVLPSLDRVRDYYDIHFMHDFPTINCPDINNIQETYGSHTLVHNWQEAIPEVIDKFKRRIARFGDLCSGSQKIYFIRHDYAPFSPGALNAKQACFLRDIIQKKYPSLDFVLVIIVQDAHNLVNEPLDKIRYGYASEPCNPREMKACLIKIDPIFQHAVVKKYSNQDYCH